MKFKERRYEDANIELTPLIDVVFMLLLFFVVSTTLYKSATQLTVQLPQANAEMLSKNQGALEIGIDAQGGYYLNGISLTSAEPKKLKLALIHKVTDLKVPVTVVGDKQTPHQAVVSALEIVSELGLTNVQIVAQSHSPS